MKIKKNGFTLTEVLIFLSLFSIFFIAAASVVVIILNNMKLQEHKILAVKYSQDLLEWLRGEKEKDWLTFVNKGNIVGVVYCFSSTNIEENWPIPNQPCENYQYLSPPIFKREAILTNNAGNPYETTSVQIEINVSWIENNKKYNVPIKTVFTIWE